jgi:hypothetical protein
MKKNHFMQPDTPHNDTYDVTKATETEGILSEVRKQRVPITFQLLLSPWARCRGSGIEMDCSSSALKLLNHLQFNICFRFNTHT